MEDALVKLPTNARKVDAMKVQIRFRKKVLCQQIQIFTNHLFSKLIVLSLCVVLQTFDVTGKKRKGDTGEKICHFSK